MNNSVVTRIQTIIDHLELSVSAFADEIGVQRSSISHLLNGRNKPSLDFVMKLVDTYPEVDLYWLLKGEGSFPKESNQEKVSEMDGDNSQKNKVPEYPERQISKIDLKNKKSDEPTKVILFYPDGTFKTFKPKLD